MAFDNVAGAGFLNLVTTKRDGTAVPTPVWFAALDDRLVIGTGSSAGKIKRIRHTRTVRVAPCTARGRITGPEAEGVAHIAGPDEARAARAALARKYRLLWRFFDRRIDAFVVIEAPD